MVTTAVVTVKETGKVDVAPVILVAPFLFQPLPLPLLALNLPSVALQVHREPPPSSLGRERRRRRNERE
jgi:hypothetical protein